MPRKSLCLKVPKQHGERSLALGDKLGIVDKELEIQKAGDYICVPLVRKPSGNEFKAIKEQIADYEVLTRVFQERRKEKTWVDFLEDKLPPHLLASLPRAIDFVGDIAIIEVPQELIAYKSALGEAILKANQNVRTVLAKAGAVSGTYRLREFTVIAGEPKTQTIHSEYGCQYYVDVAKAYFSPRLSFEHNRIAATVREGETVIDLFAGVGPFAIQIAKNHGNVKVYAIDVNPEAVKFLKKNIILNKVVGKVHPILGDAKEVVSEKLSGTADRVIMNLPEKAIEFLDVACEAVKPSGGIVHFFSLVNSSNTLDDVKNRLIEEVEKSGRKLEEFVFSRFVRETAPHKWQVVLDINIH
jgi:tRNA (guanine37-N1)-methyltransferase